VRNLSCLSLLLTLFPLCSCLCELCVTIPLCLSSPPLLFFLSLLYVLYLIYLNKSPLPTCSHFNLPLHWKVVHHLSFYPALPVFVEEHTHADA
jgi:hypothetical protein